MRAQLPKSSLMALLKPAEAMLGHEHVALQHVLLQSRPGALRGTTTNLQASFSAGVPAVTKPGSVLLPLPRLRSIVSGLPDGEVTITADMKHGADIVSGSARVSLSGLIVSEFPMPMGLEGVTSLTMAQADLAAAIERTRFAMAPEFEAQHPIAGIHFRFADGKIRLTATDRFRVAWVEPPATGLTDCEFIIPAKVVATIRSILGSEGNVMIEVTRSEARFSAGPSEIRTRLLEGKWPNLTKMIPEPLITVSFPREAVIDALKRSEALRHDVKHGTMFDFKDESLTLTTRHPDAGEIVEILPLGRPTPEFSIKMDAKKLGPILSALTADAVEMRCMDHLRPVVFLGDTGFFGLVVPMNPAL